MCGFLMSHALGALMILLAFGVFVFNAAKVVSLDAYRLIVLLLLGALVMTLHGMSHSMMHKMKHKEMFSNTEETFEGGDDAMKKLEQFADDGEAMKKLEMFAEMPDEEKKKMMDMFSAAFKAQ